MDMMTDAKQIAQHEAARSGAQALLSEDLVIEPAVPLQAVFSAPLAGHADAEPLRPLYISSASASASSSSGGTAGASTAGASTTGAVGATGASPSAAGELAPSATALRWTWSSAIPTTPRGAPGWMSGCPATG